MLTVNVWWMARIGIACCALSAPVQAADTEFGAELEGSMSLPPVYTGGTGAVRMTLRDGNPPLLSYHPLCARNLLDPAASADIYAYAATQQQGKRTDRLSVSHKRTFSDEQDYKPITPGSADAIKKGVAAITVATVTHPDGEIRGLIYQCASGGCPPLNSSHCSK